MGLQYGFKNPDWVNVKTGLYCGLRHGKLYVLTIIMMVDPVADTLTSQ